MAPNDDSNITEQVGSRLDDLFGEGEISGADDASLTVESRSGCSGDVDPSSLLGGHDGDIPGKTPSIDIMDTQVYRIDAEEIEKSPIKELKSIVLSLEWEITVGVMKKLEEEIRKLETLCQGDKVILAYLQLLGSLGKYIRKKLARAHVDSITLLHSVYESLEKAMLSKEMSDATKKKMLVAHVTRYKKLKNEIQSAKPSSSLDGSEGRRLTPIPAPESNVRPLSEHSTGHHPSDDKDLTHMTREILKSMKAIQQTIQSEMTLLREEMRRLVEAKK